MDLEIAPGIFLQEGRVNIIIEPVERFVDFFNETQNLQRFMTLFVSGNFSRILSGLDRTVTRIDIRRAFTSHQLQTILDENYHTVVVFEFDPTIFDGDPRMKDVIAQKLVELSYSSLVIVYSPASDRVLSRILRGIDRLFLYGASGEFSPDYARMQMRRRKPAVTGRQEMLKQEY